MNSEKKFHSIRIRRAKIEDLNKIKSILMLAQLPFEDINSHLNHFIVAEEKGEMIGTAGMEVYEDMALLRSMAVSPEFQGYGIGIELCQAILSRAAELKISEIYLLTETAEGFFRKQGFSLISRKLVPQKISETTEFSTLCPQSAICMFKQLTW